MGTGSISGGAVSFENVGNGDYQVGIKSVKDANGNEISIPKDGIKIEITLQDGSVILMPPGNMLNIKSIDEIANVSIIFTLDDLQGSIAAADKVFVENPSMFLQNNTTETKKGIDSLRSKPETNLVMMLAALMSTIVMTQAMTQRLFSLQSQNSLMETFNLNMKAADKKVEAAKQKRDTAIAQGITEIVAGGINVICSVASFFAPNEAVAKGIQSLGQGLSQLTTGIGKVATANMQLKADQLSADADRIQAEAGLVQGLNQNLGSSLSAIQQMISATLQTYKALLDIINQGNMTLASAIGGR
jgi:hypothetical protein